MANKLVVLGIPWDVETEGLRMYMSKFGEIEDCIVMKDRATGRSRGFGYVTFASADDAKKAVESGHVLGTRTLEVKIATPKEEMMSSASKKATRIFVARIPPSVNETTFQNYFATYGAINDVYMPKDQVTKNHRGIGFVTFESSDSVDALMSETHEIGGSTVVVDRATPKEEDSRQPFRFSQGGYGAYNAYMSAATRYAALGAPTLYDNPVPAYGSGPRPNRGGGKKIFVGRLPQEATVDDLRAYFSRFGHIIDAYIPKDPKKSGHRGFGFVTFNEDGVVDRVSRRTHEIRGHEVVIDCATPVDDKSNAGASYTNPADASAAQAAAAAAAAYGGFSGPMRGYGRMYGSLDFDDWGYGAVGTNKTTSRMDWRYKPY